MVVDSVVESSISSEMARKAKIRFPDSEAWAEVAVSAAAVVVVTFGRDAVVLLREIELR